VRAILLPAALLLGALLLGLLATAIWLISQAHGHGLTSGDREAIVVLTFASLTSLVAGFVALSRR